MMWEEGFSSQSKFLWVLQMSRMQLFRQLLEQSSTTPLPKGRGTWCQSRTMLMVNLRLWHRNVFSGLVAVPCTPPYTDSLYLSLKQVFSQYNPVCKHVCICLNIIVESLPFPSSLPTFLGNMSFLIWVSQSSIQQTCIHCSPYARQWCGHREYRS